MMLRTWSTNFLAAAGTLAAAFCVAASASAALIVNDTWRDGTRTDPAPPTYSENGVDSDADGDLESAWFTSNAAGATVTPGHYAQATASGSTSWSTYFTPESSPITLANTGDTLKVTWVFKPAGVANDATSNTGQNFRLAVVNSPSAARVATDTAPGAPGVENYLGYAMFMNMDQTLRRSTPFQLMERTAGTAAFLGTGADWVGLVDDGATNDPGYASGTEYTYTMTMVRNAVAGLDIVSRMQGTGLGPLGQGFLQVSFTDPTPSSFVFDMFGIRPSGSATSATSFDTSLFRVEGPIAVPEPTALCLFGLGCIGALGGLRRRK